MDVPVNHSVYNVINVPTVGNTCGIDFAQDAIFLPVFYGIFFIFGVPLNILALYGLYRLIRSENILPVFVINLLLSDLLQLLTLPLWMDYYRNRHLWRFGNRTCQFVSLVFYVSIYVGIFFMCLIAVERHLAIAHPLKFQSVRRLKHAMWVALGAWVIVALPPSIAFDTMFPSRPNYTLCIEKYPSEANFITYRLITLLLSFILPFCFIFSLHTMTLRSLGRLATLQPAEKNRIRRFLNLLLAIFVLVLGPYHLTGCVKYVGLVVHPRTCDWERAVFTPYQLGRGLISLNSLLDPVLYIFLRSDFREAVRVYMPCLGQVHWTSAPRSSNRGASYKTSYRATTSTQESDVCT